MTIAGPADLPFLLHLQKRFSNQLGFLPKAALLEYLERGRVLLASENGEPAGYLLGPARLRDLPQVRPLVQTAVCLDLHRRGLALRLVAAAAAAAAAEGSQVLQAWCRSDIAATAFWTAAGFTAVAQRRTGNRRGRPLVLFRRRLDDPSALPPLFLPPRAGCHGERVRDGRVFTSALQRRILSWGA